MLAENARLYCSNQQVTMKNTIGLQYIAPAPSLDQPPEKYIAHVTDT